MTPKEIFFKLVNAAGSMRLLYDRAPRAKDVGQLVTSLPESERKVLEQLKSDDVSNLVFNDWTHPRPQK